MAARKKAAAKRPREEGSVRTRGPIKPVLQRDLLNGGRVAKALGGLARKYNLDEVKLKVEFGELYQNAGGSRGMRVEVPQEWKDAFRSYLQGRIDFSEFKMRTGANATTVSGILGRCARAIAGEEPSRV